MEPPGALKADFFVLYVLRICFFSAAVRGSRKIKIPIKAFIVRYSTNLCRLSHVGGLTKIRQKPCQVKNELFALF